LKTDPRNAEYKRPDADSEYELLVISNFIDILVKNYHR